MNLDVLMKKQESSKREKKAFQYIEKNDKDKGK
jgi:hypothetical protein